MPYLSEETVNEIVH